MYDVIVLGATYVAAAVAKRYGKTCMVIERQMQAGYEFFGAECDGDVYAALKGCHAVFGAEVVSTEKTEEGFLCKILGVDGFRSYQAKRVIDTRCNDEMSCSKTYNLLIESGEEPSFEGVTWEGARGENRYILRCPIPLGWGYPQARELVRQVICRFSSTQRLILSANLFEYRVKAEYPKTVEGILYVPSQGYGDPHTAYEEGLKL